jgi:galactose mutarotase-like enzyme
MAKLFGKEWTRAELLAHVGDLSQVAGVRLLELSDGVERGVRAADVRTGGGLEFTVLLDRGMDIGAASYKGLPLAWISPAGFAHPAHFEPEGLGWLRTFGGGLMTGCGLTYLGAPGEDEGEHLGLHGRLSHLPARHVGSGQEWEMDECSFWVDGELRQARLFGENLALTRRIETWLGQNRLNIHDTVENLGDSSTPLMMLYHINLGFPLLDASCRLEAPAHNVRPRDKVAEPGIGEWMQFQEPATGYKEQAFIHNLPADAEGWASAKLVNPTLGVWLSLRFRKESLPSLVQWKQMGQGAYVLGLEPANCGVEGRAEDRGRGTLEFLEPDESREFEVEIEVGEA